MMRAWVSERAGELVLATAARPRPKPGEVVVAVQAAPLNFSDLLMIDDRYQVKPPRPFTPGQEIAGVIVEAGEGAGVPVGTAVAGKVLWGGFAEHAVMRADMAIRVPAGLSIAAASTLPVVYTTAIVALEHLCRIERGAVVLVHAAAGGVGLAAVEVAKALGATVIATAGATEKLAVAKAHGADHGVVYRDPDWPNAVRALTAGKGADVIFDPVGGEVTQGSLRCIAQDGALLIVGFASGEIPQIPAHRLLLRRAAAKGVYWDHDQDGPMLARVGERMAELLRKGAIRPEIDDRFGFEELPQALEELRQRRSTGKLVLRVK
jgi:NADPH:quinone reductase